MGAGPISMNMCGCDGRIDVCRRVGRAFESRPRTGEKLMSVNNLVGAQLLQTQLATLNEMCDSDARTRSMRSTFVLSAQPSRAVLLAQGAHAVVRGSLLVLLALP